MKKQKVTGIAIAMSLALGLAGSATFAQAQDMPSWCGPKKVSVALLDGFGGNGWRQITSAAAKQEAAKCPSVTEYLYSDAQGDVQKAIIDINTMAARGVDAIVVFPDAGPAVLPAITAAHRAGAVVVPYRQEVGGEEGVNYSKFIGASFVNDGVNFGNFIKREFPDGANILFLGGPAGNSVSLQELEGLNSVLGPEYVYVNPEPFHVTNWDPALTQQILSAEVVKQERIDVVLAEFGSALIGGLSAFGVNGKSIPAVVAEGGNVLSCYWEENKDANPDFKLFTVGAGIDNSRLAIRWAVALATGGTPPETTTYTSDVFEDSVTGDPNPVTCRPDLPGAVFLDAEMSGEDQAAVIQ
ncbi:substrate-binding domain-containing protein [Sinisalibacter aestuarii]|uniref:Periplasmic binding protein domain-containing protein n=1 Tax=Sinisalibacter aestuarii TaxID=2949426 RepID=A0ABQ5LRX2_9RHOB|nr:substrate-binding domain-containing protein [Sinisalibacter aestuarii]GKY87755.1 hypothetical protein STA1M1_16240 [Sinisalibacter aestuarii]